MGNSKGLHMKLYGVEFDPCTLLTLTHSYVITSSQIAFVVVTSNGTIVYHSTGSPNLCLILRPWSVASTVVEPQGESICKFQVHWREKPSVFVPVIVTTQLETKGLAVESFAEAGAKSASQKMENEGAAAVNVRAGTAPATSTAYVQVNGQSAFVTLDRSTGYAASEIVYT